MVYWYLWCLDVPLTIVYHSHQLINNIHIYTVHFLTNYNLDV